MYVFMYTDHTHKVLIVLVLGPEGMGPLKGSRYPCV